MVNFFSLVRDIVLNFAPPKVNIKSDIPVINTPRT